MPCVTLRLTARCARGNQIRQLIWAHQRLGHLVLDVPASIKCHDNTAVKALALAALEHFAALGHSFG